jgi:hypothetical protein
LCGHWCSESADVGVAQRRAMMAGGSDRRLGRYIMDMQVWNAGVECRCRKTGTCQARGNRGRGMHVLRGGWWRFESGNWRGWGALAAHRRRLMLSREHPVARY